MNSQSDCDNPHDHKDCCFPKVLNKYKDVIPKDSIYIGRPSKWGNPFEIGKDGDRDEVVDKYAAYLFSNRELFHAAKTELKGKSLVCFCAPKKCHGDVLYWVANNIMDVKPKYIGGNE